MSQQTLKPLASTCQEYRGPLYTTYGPFERVPHVLIPVVGEVA